MLYNLCTLDFILLSINKQTNNNNKKKQQLKENVICEQESNKLIFS